VHCCLQSGKCLFIKTWGYGCYAAAAKELKSYWLVRYTIYNYNIHLLYCKVQVKYNDNNNYKVVVVVEELNNLALHLLRTSTTLLLLLGRVGRGKSSLMMTDDDDNEAV
jgi:hypothetical protein